jgi:hypothetical protein
VVISAFCTFSYSLCSTLGLDADTKTLMESLWSGDIDLKKMLTDELMTNDNIELVRQQMQQVAFDTPELFDELKIPKDVLDNPELFENLLVDGLEQIMTTDTEETTTNQLQKLKKYQA